MRPKQFQTHQQSSVIWELFLKSFVSINSWFKFAGFHSFRSTETDGAAASIRMEHCGWGRLMMCESDLMYETKISSSTLFSVFIHVLGYHVLVLELWTVFVVMKGIFVSAQIFSSAHHIPFCSFTAFFAACHITLMCTY